MTSMIASCAAGPIVEFGGRFLRVYPRTLRNLAEIKAQVMHLRGDALTLARVMVAEAPDGQSEAIAASCLKTIRHRWSDVNSSEMNRFMLTIEGRVLSVFQAFEPNGVTYDWVFDRFCEKCEESGDEWYYDLMWRVRMASGDIELFDLCSIRNVSEYKVDELYDRYGGDGGILSALCREPFSMSPHDVSNLTFAQIRSVLTGRESDNDDRPTELSEVQKPVNKGHRRLMEETWKKRYSPLIQNLVQGRALFDNLTH